MPDWPVLTDRVILGTTVFLAIYTIVATVCGGGPASISARMQHHGYRAPMIVGAWFALGAHWWWSVYARTQ